MSEISCTMAMIAIIGALYVSFVSDSIVGYKNDKQRIKSSKTISEVLNGDFEKDIRIKMKTERSQASEILGDSFFNEMLKFSE